MPRGTLTEDDLVFTTKDEDGSGLGLATVHGIVIAGGGSLTVESELGRGSRFQVFLPTLDRAPLSDAAQQPRPSGAARPGATILLAEDDDRVRRLIESALRSVGHRVLVAEHGERALVLAGEETEGVDLLITDIVMPRLGGIELSERLSEMHPKARTLFISGYSDHPLPATARVLAKPFRPDELVREANRVLSES